MARLNSPTCPTALDTRGALLACGRSEWPVDNRKWVFLRSTVDRALWYPQRGGQSAVGGENVPELSACVLRVWQAPLGLDPTPSSFSSSAVLDHLQAPRHNHTLSQNRTERTQIRIQMQCVARAAQCNASHLCFKPSHKFPRRHDYDPWSGIRRGTPRSARLCCGSRTNRHGNHDNPKDD
jgi:hypothetical protein